MVKKSKIRFAGIYLLLVAISVILLALMKTTVTKAIEPVKNNASVKNFIKKFSEHKNAGENEKCFKCHGQSNYSYENKGEHKQVRQRMYSELIIDRNLFYESNHREFKCIDCHSEDYISFPHAGNLRMEAKPNCIDCHGGDEKYAKYHFENIEKEFQESVHSEKHSADFTCWMCHNGHVYKITARTNENIKQTVAYDNAICLGCHGDITRYQVLTDKENPNMIRKHDWLPNQPLHFRSVRCIECHAKKLNDSVLVTHKILPKNEAVKLCTECHSTNSILMASLYKYKIREIRSAKGFFSGVIVNDSYVIGANRNYFLNIASLIIFGLVIIGIIIHAFLRISK